MTIRGSFFVKYVVYFVPLVTIAPIVGGGISVVFTNKESKTALLELQRENAAAAVSKIEAYVSEIEQQLGRLWQSGTAPLRLSEIVTFGACHHGRHAT